MAESSAILGKGTTLGYADTSGGTYTSVGEVIDTGTPDPTPDEVECTHYASPDDYKEIKFGWIDGGEVTFQINFVKAQMTTLEGLRYSAKWWKVTLSDGSTYVFPGKLKRLNTAPPIGDRVTSSATIRVTGEHTYAAAA